MAKLSMRAETPSWVTRMRTCRFLGEENLSRRRCITSCGSAERMECTRESYRVTPPRMAVFGCPRNMQLRFSIPLVSELQSLLLAERPPAVMGANRDPGSQQAAIDMQTRAPAHVLIRVLRHHRHIGGGKLIRYYGRCAGDLSTFALAVLGPLEAGALGFKVFLVPSGIDGRFFGAVSACIGD